MKIRIKKDYPYAYNSLREGYEQTKNCVKNIDLHDKDLNTMKDRLFVGEMPKTGDMFADLKNTQSIINQTISSLKEIEAQYDSKASDNPDLLSKTKIYIQTISTLVSRFVGSLNSLTEDLKLQSLQHDWEDSLLKLVDAKEIDHRDKDGNTLLMKATSQAQPPAKIINKLLELGADPFTKCRFDETPFSKAIGNDNLDLAKIYFHYKVDHLSQPAKVIALGALQKLEAASTPKIFYEELALDLQDSSLTDVLGLDQDSIQTCLTHVGKGYEALGLDSGILIDTH